MANFFYHKSPNHVQIPDLGHFLEKIITLLNLYLVLLLEQSIVQNRIIPKIAENRGHAVQILH